MAKLNLKTNPHQPDTNLTHIQAQKSVANFLDIVADDPEWGLEEAESCLPAGWWFGCETDEEFNKCEDSLQVALCVGDDDEPEISKALIDAFVGMARPCPAVNC